MVQGCEVVECQNGSRKLAGSLVRGEVDRGAADTFVLILPVVSFGWSKGTELQDRMNRMNRMVVFQLGAEARRGGERPPLEAQAESSHTTAPPRWGFPTGSWPCRGGTCNRAPSAECRVPRLPSLPLTVQCGTRPPMGFRRPPRSRPIGAPRLPQAVATGRPVELTVWPGACRSGRRSKSRLGALRHR